MKNREPTNLKRRFLPHWIAFGAIVILLSLTNIIHDSRKGDKSDILMTFILVPVSVAVIAVFFWLLSWLFKKNLTLARFLDILLIVAFTMLIFSVVSLTLDFLRN